MLIPTSSDDLCPSKLLARSFSSDVTSTAESFKTWDTCMDNKTCKIVAIVGICLAAVVAIWLVGGILRCFCSGVTNICEALCCCCTCGRSYRHRNRDIDAPQGAQNPFDNPHMYPAKEQPVQTNHYHAPPQQAYYGTGTVSDEYKGGAAEKYYDPYANARRNNNNY